FKQMKNGRARPAHVEVPLDVLSEFGEANFFAATEARASAPDAADIARAAELLKGAERIAIWCGGGAVSSAAGVAIGALAEQLGAPIITSTMGKGSVPDDHPMVIGRLWEPGNPVDDLLKSVDAALVFGSKLGAMETEYQRMPLPQTLIRIDVDPEEIHRNYKPAHAIVADARLAAEALLGALRDAGVQKTGLSAGEISTLKSNALDASWGAAQKPYVDALRSAIPRDGILVSDMTMMGYVCCARYPVYEPRTFLFPQGYGTLGFSLPAAIGAKIARPDATVVPIVGDGGFQYTMQEVATAVQFKAGLPIVIFNDSTYTAVKSEQASKYDRRFIAVDLVNPDYLKLADAYGIPSVRAESPEALSDAIAAAAQRDQPTIIDTPISFES
ncbi:MAG TPA: thiamine pyrophosphate-dependent enzyme, partial [Nitrolancea sp.]|nr:thiamine pyrophosphate-dependent enzyme [Nitrolancea sp.]